MRAVLRVAVPVPLPRLFDYLAPEGPLPQAVPGCRVVVPLGRREVVGIVLEIVDNVADPRQLRAASSWLDLHNRFGEELLQSLRWASAYYAHPLGEVLAAALPTALRSVTPVRLSMPAELRRYTVTAEGRAALDAPQRAGLLRTLLMTLAESDRSHAELSALGPRVATSLRALQERGWIARTASTAPVAAARPGPICNADQRAAIGAVTAQRGFAAFLLDGVTGSGKTEVYLAAIAQAVAAQRQCLVLVPEIGLTPQALQRYRQRLGVPVLALHSALADGERAAAWLAAAAGDAPVLIGTRSAVFTPLARPGLIVVDEEHDSSYKQLEGFRYHARDLALVRARALDIPVLLGSATPALESLANADAGRYRHLRLSRRAGAAATPSVSVIDLRKTRLHEGLAPATLDAIAATLARDEQVLVFRNRRGFAPVLLCHDCGWQAECPRCDVPMTLHAASGLLRCHHCGGSSRRPTTCPACARSALMALGSGTERIEAALQARFPGVPVLRIDRDTTRRRGALAALLARAQEGRPAILVGTQMLAKGHDLPELTLVVLVDVDGGLFSADFRGPERLAQLVVQVAGRAGRAAKPGRVLLQTHHPDHPQLQELLGGGYRAFARRELSEREALGFPPFVHFALLRAEARDQAALDAFFTAARGLFETDTEVTLRGPMPAPMPRRAGLQRAQLLLEAARRAPLHRLLAGALDALYDLPAARRVRWSLPVDPVELD